MTATPGRLAGTAVPAFPAGPAGPADAAAVTRFLDEILPGAFDVFPPRVSPHLASARSHLSGWVERHGLVRKPAARRRFEHADFGWFAAVTYPTADQAGLHLIADWFAWLFLLDDQFDDGVFGRDPGRVETLMTQMAAVLGGDGDPAGRAEGVPAIVTALADLWHRTLPRAAPGWRDRFVDHIVAGGLAAAWEAENRARGVVPGEPAYIDKRRHTGAIYVCMDLIEIAERTPVPPPAYADAAYQQALRAACDVVCWTNDVYSLEKELSVGEYHNLVAVVEHARGLTRGASVAHVASAISTRIRDFREWEGRTLHAFRGDAVALANNFAGMRSWMRGNLDWSARTKRYRPGGPAGAGRPADYLDTGLVQA
ncbi:hypothetical protein Sru01_25390 [Sphaerisporangium rufum]|uniref:Terpene synthase n=1 Tax=Sphaerisporangium rufum TaxID=1381558 RepID=A0A919R5L7_9ACTN|nr:terpene cyclase [Sphaerisporangium rufum]GII77557.1 hypothetical protein Sru01_25390 [Sphaerisporangium rufum]